MEEEAQGEGEVSDHSYRYMPKGSGLWFFAITSWRYRAPRGIAETAEFVWQFPGAYRRFRRAMQSSE